MKKEKVSESFSPSMDIQVSSNFERLFFTIQKIHHTPVNFIKN